MEWGHYCCRSLENTGTVFYHSALIDVSCFSHLTWLSLEDCNDIKDIHSLETIPNLFIIDCDGIRDISALQNNRKLTIYGCYNISLSTVNFENILYLSTDLNLTYDATATLKNAIFLELSNFDCSDLFLSSTVVSVEFKNTDDFILPPLEIDLSTFSQSLKSVLLDNISSRVDLTPLRDVEKVQLEYCRDLINVNGLGKNNKTVIIKSCDKIIDLSALKSTPRVIIESCTNFVNCEDLNHVRYLTIQCVSRKMDFTGLKREKGGRVHRLELLNCDAVVSFKGLNGIPFLKITSTRHLHVNNLHSLEGIGGLESKIILIEAKYESLADRFILTNCYSKTFYKDVTSESNCLMLQLTRK
jgi:hypothetical protein